MLDTASTPRIAVIFRLRSFFGYPHHTGQNTHIHNPGGFLSPRNRGDDDNTRIVELPGCFNCLWPVAWARVLRVHEAKEGRRDAEEDWGKGLERTSSAYPRLASTTRSCSFCLSVNKRSSMDRSASSLGLLYSPPLLFLMLSAIRVLISSSRGLSSSDGQEPTILNCTRVQATWYTLVSRLRASFVAGRNRSKLWNRFFDRVTLATSEFRDILLSRIIRYDDDSFAI